MILNTILIIQDDAKIILVRRLMVDSSQLTFVPTTKSRDTKTRTNIKNMARSNLHTVP